MQVFCNPLPPSFPLPYARTYIRTRPLALETNQQIKPYQGYEVARRATCGKLHAQEGHAHTEGKVI